MSVYLSSTAHCTTLPSRKLFSILLQSNSIPPCLPSLRLSSSHGIHDTIMSLTDVYRDYSAKVFGFHTFGKVYGLIMCLGGLFNFSQAALDTLTHRVFGKDPNPVNGMLLGVALVVGLALVGFVWYRSRSLKRERLEDEAEGATETLMPGAGAGSGSGGVLC